MSTMSDTNELPDTKVETLLKATPRAVRFFLDWHTSCANCGFARFCSLRDVIKTYQLDEQKFLKEAEEVLAQKNITWSAK